MTRGRLSFLRSALLLAALLPLGSARAATKPKCPNVLILFDKSGSMAEEPNGTFTQCDSDSDCAAAPRKCITAAVACQSPTSKMSVAAKNIGDVVAGANASLRFGLSYYGASQACSAQAGNVVNSVACGYSTSTPIRTALGALTPSGATPSGAALEAVSRLGDLTDATRARYLIVVTDGQPSCLLPPDETVDTEKPNPNAPGSRSIEAIQALQVSGVKTFVVGFGGVTANPNAVAILNGMARAGQPAYPDGGFAKAFSASDGTALNTALNEVLSRAQGELGAGGCDDSCASQGCPSGQRCNTNAVPAVCVADPCNPNPCQSGEYCRQEGNAAVCIRGCVETCASGKACVDGLCTTDRCNQGTCRSDCPTGQAPDVTGQCAADQCPTLLAQGRCPTDTPYCLYNTCFGNQRPATTGTSGGGETQDAGGTTGRRPNGSVSTEGGCGCTSVDALSLAAVLVAGLGSVARRRR